MRKVYMGIFRKCGTIVVFVVSMALMLSAQQSGNSAIAANHSVSSANVPGNPAATTSSPDPVVLKVGATEVTQSEIESFFSDAPGLRKLRLNSTARQHMADLYLRMLLLSQMAVREHVDESPALKHRLELQREKMLAQAEYDKMRGQFQVSREEVSHYYTEHQAEFDTVEVREFLVPKQTKDAEGNLSPAKDPQAKAEAVRKALESGKTPEEVAQEFPSSEVVLVDPKSRTLRRNEMVPALAKASFDTKDGHVSPPVDTPDAVLVVLVFNHGHLSQEQVTPQLEKKLVEQKMDAELDELKKNAGIWMNQDYFSKDEVPAAPKAGPGK